MPLWCGPVLSFACGHCGRLVFFQNTVCLHCSTELGFVPERMELVAVDRSPDSELHRCANAELVIGGEAWDACRTLFGDERADYGAAVEPHYAQGPGGDWAEAHMSAYATMHPWEDWAETFAHYLPSPKRSTPSTPAWARRPLPLHLAPAGHRQAALRPRPGAGGRGRGARVTQEAC